MWGSLAPPTTRCSVQNPGTTTGLGEPHTCNYAAVESVSPAASRTMREGTALSITVFSKPNCVQCSATYRALDKHGLSYEVVDLSMDAEALESVKALGYAQAPVVIAEGDHWAGFRPDKIKALAAVAVSVDAVVGA